MCTNKNSRSKTPASPAKPPQTRHAPTPHLPFRNAGVPPALLQQPIPAPTFRCPKTLIANPRLEFHPKPTKQTTALTSNRERMAISESDFPARELLVAADQQSRFIGHEISNRNIRFTENQLSPATAAHTHFLTATKQPSAQNSNIAPAPLLARPRRDNFQFNRDLAPSNMPSNS